MKKVKKKKIKKKERSPEDLKRRKKMLKRIMIEKAAEAQEAKAKRERIATLKTTIKGKMDGFAKKHKTYLPCYPNGRKKNTKGEIKTVSYWQQIYICEAICNRQCDEFRVKTYICRDIGCTNYPVCITRTPEKRKQICKSKNLFGERVKLNKLYKKYFLLMGIYRGLKIDLNKTLRYLDQKKKSKKKETLNGKIQHKSDRKKGSPSKKGKARSNKSVPSPKTSSKSNTKRRKKIKN